MGFTIQTRRIVGAAPENWAYWIYRDDEITAVHAADEFESRAAARTAAQAWIAEHGEGGFK